MVISQAEGYIENVLFFRRIHALSLGYKMKPKNKAFSCVKTKTNPNFAVKIGERSIDSFSAY